MPGHAAGDCSMETAEAVSRPPRLPRLPGLL